MSIGYTKLFSSIITSTIWAEDDATRIVWITMLATANKNGEVQASVPGLARIAGVSVEACEKAIEKFLSPDKHSRTKDDEGRRIEIIDGGWALLNYGKYREMASRDEAQDANRKRQRRFYEKQRRNASDDPNAPNGNLTEPNGELTHTLHIAEAEAEAKKNKSTPSDEVFAYWQSATGHTQSKLTDDRRSKINARLKEGYSVEFIKRAVDGCLSSAFHRGENPDGKVWDSLNLICRSGGKLEEFAALAPELAQPTKPLTPKPAKPEEETIGLEEAIRRGIIKPDGRGVYSAQRRSRDGNPRPPDAELRANVDLSANEFDDR